MRRFYTAWQTKHSKKWVCKACKDNNQHLMYEIERIVDPSVMLTCYRCGNVIKKGGPIYV